MMELESTESVAQFVPGAQGRKMLPRCVHVINPVPEHDLNPSWVVPSHLLTTSPFVWGRAVTAATRETRTIKMECIL
jgi:hypothetical protein